MKCGKVKISGACLVYLTILAIINIILTYLWITQSDGSKHPHIRNDIACYNDIKDDGLPYIDKSDIMQIPDKILFVETSCRGELDSIQACAIESAARANVKSLVIVVFAGPVKKATLNKGFFAALRNLNVNFVRIHLHKEVTDTPLERIVTDIVSHSSAKVAHASDVLRILLLWKYGGTYLDLDFVVLQSLEELGNDFAAIEDNNTVATGAMRISDSDIGNKISAGLLNELGTAFEFNPKSWSGIGPVLLTKLLITICNTTEVTLMDKEKCQGFHVYDQKSFYPLGPSDWRMLYKPGGVDLSKSYAIHLWNKFISGYQRVVKIDSIYANLARGYCPAVYNLSAGRLGT